MIYGWKGMKFQSIKGISSEDTRNNNNINNNTTLLSWHNQPGEMRVKNDIDFVNNYVDHTSTKDIKSDKFNSLWPNSYF